MCTWPYLWILEVFFTVAMCCSFSPQEAMGLDVYVSVLFVINCIGFYYVFFVSKNIANVVCMHCPKEMLSKDC